MSNKHGRIFYYEYFNTHHSVQSNINGKLSEDEESLPRREHRLRLQRHHAARYLVIAI